MLISAIRTLQRFVTQFRDFTKGKPGSGKQKVKRTPENIEIVELVIEEASTTSIWHLTQQMELSDGTCQVIPKKDLALYP
jgi:hypothetical protein